MDLFDPGIPLVGRPFGRSVSSHLQGILDALDLLRSSASSVQQASKMGKKSKGRKANNKGKRGGGGGNRGGGASSDPSTLIKGRIPDLDGAQNSSSNSPNCPTIYTRYKDATRRFLEYMRGNVPSDESATDINFLLAAAEHMRETNRPVDRCALRDLRLCIRMRRRVADSMFGGGDAGHRHFVQVLVFCWTALRLLPVAGDGDKHVGSEPSAEEEDAGFANRFSAFEDNEEEEAAEEEDEDMFPTTAPRPPPAEHPLTVEDLMSSDDRNDAVLFLLTLDELMGLVSVQYRALVQNMRRRAGPRELDTSMVENLMEGTIAANFAMQSVSLLEAELQAQHAHLTTPCRLLATVAMPEITAHIDSIVKENGSKKCSRCDIIAFLGDSIQCGFHNSSDSWSRRDTIVSEFASEFGVDDAGRSELEQLFQTLLRLTILELPMKPDGAETMREDLARAAGKPHPSHSWLANMKFISGDRAIHHTIRVLQLFGGVIDSSQSDKKLLMDPRRRGVFGNPLWAPGWSNRIRDMDELVMSRLLPDWVNMCRHGIIGKIKLPRDAELCPFFVQLKSYVENPRRPVTWSLAFGVHAALSSMVEGGRALPDIVDISKMVFSTYFSQATNAVKLSLKEASSSLKSAPAWEHNICMISFLENFGLPVYDDLALWNPLCGGTSISVVNYFGNIEGGCALIDCRAQLRLVMYLYHGLVINGIFNEDEIPMLQILYKGFKNCKAIWQGSLPKRGELVKRFWQSFGLGISDSKRMSQNAQLLAGGGRLPSDGIFEQGVRLSRGRKMQPIEPAEILTSFRRICERDFHDAVDKYHTPEQKRNTRGMEQYTVAVRTNDTIDHLESEIQLHALNFVPTAYYLEQFICSVTRVLGFEGLLNSFERNTNMEMRQGFAIIFAQHVLGVLDFASNPLNHTYQNVPGLVAMSPSPHIIGCAAQFLEVFFGKLPAQDVLWFQALEYGDETSTQVVRNL